MDRFDAKYIKDLDSMHFIMPFMYPNRCDNEAFFSFHIDLTEVQKYINKKKICKAFLTLEDWEV